MNFTNFQKGCFGRVYHYRWMTSNIFICKCADATTLTTFWPVFLVTVTNGCLKVPHFYGRSPILTFQTIIWNQLHWLTTSYTSRFLTKRQLLHLHKKKSSSVSSSNTTPGNHHSSFDSLGSKVWKYYLYFNYLLYRISLYLEQSFALFRLNSSSSLSNKLLVILIIPLANSQNNSFTFIT